MLFNCKHNWRLLSETITKSQFEGAIEATKNDRNIRIPSQMCNMNRKVIQLVCCDKCGCIRKFVEKI